MRTKAKKKLFACHSCIFHRVFGCDDKTFLCDDRSGGQIFKFSQKPASKRPGDQSAKRQYLRQKWRKDCFKQSSLFDLCDIFSGDRQGKSNKGLI